MQRIFKLEYTWYDGEQESVFIITDLTEEEFEKKLTQFYEDVKKEGGYIPHYFNFIIEMFEKLGYAVTYTYENGIYDVGDNKISKLEVKKEWKEI